MILAVAQRIPPCDPLPWLASIRTRERFYWHSGEDGRAIAAAGVLTAVEANGTQRFATAARRCREVVRELRWAGDAPPPPTLPLFVGGFAFGPDAAEELWAGFPPARWVLPERLVTCFGEETWALRLRRAPSVASALATERLVGAARRELERMAGTLQRCGTAWEKRPQTIDAPLGQPTPCGRAVSLEAMGPGTNGHAYAARVRRAIASIRAGELEKVVVARAVSCPARLTDPFRALETLGHREPACRIFAVGRGERVFLGASPERLIRVEGDRVSLDALAGSAPRGHTTEEDARLARELSESKKEQEEHAVVVRALREALTGRCGELHVPQAPRIKRLAAVQHLHTPITGRLGNQRRFVLLELLAALHPTPAIAGAPRGAALAWLRRHEGLVRGWYAGLVGWLSARGDGELGVALRSARSTPEGVTLFAGAGVMGNSDPEAELRETQLKLRSTAEALGIPAR